MTDQVDVLLAGLVNKLNIYNIPDTVYQKNIKTNTQNNLDIIFSSPNYKPVTDALNNSEEILNKLANKILPNNELRNEIIVKSLMHDVLYNFILLTDGELEKSGKNMENYQFDNIYKDDTDFVMLVKYITFFLQCSRKGIDPKLAAESLANVCLFTLNKFTEKHNGEDVKSYGFGSTAHTYKIGDKLLKRYNDKLRWSTDGHDNVDDIIDKELEILTKIKHINGTPNLIFSEDRSIYMTYNGESLYNDFNLPDNWKEQITQIFSDLTDNGIFYPEFRLQNILVLDDKITFVDFGLAEFRNECDNTVNLEKFINYLGSMEERFKNVNDIDELHRLISTFSINKGL